MYDELIKDLRENHDKYFARDMQVADAIEELQKCLDGVSADNDSLCATIDEIERDLKRSKEYEAFWEKEAKEALKKFQTTVASMPRWIPVTERLPDDRRDVQITVFWHDAWRTMYGYYDGAYWHLYAPMHTEVADVYVIGWMEKPAPMPLPEPPKEET